MPVEHDITTVGGRCTTTVASHGAGPPLLYLHGPFGLVEHAFVDRLAARHTVYVPAHPGFTGTTGAESLGPTMFDLALHYEELIRGLGVEPPLTVVGHSYGAMIAAEVAAIWPNLVDRLALISPLGIWLDDAPQPDLFGLTPRALAAAVFADASSPAATGMFRPPEDRAAAAEWNARRRQSAVGAAKYLWPLPDRGWRTRAHRVRATTRLIWGVEDKVVPPQPYAAAFSAALPGSVVTTVEDAGHMVVLERPDAVADCVLCDVAPTN